MAYKEDSDIKIFSSTPKVRDDEFPRQLEILDHHRQTGNLEKAAELGHKLFDLVVEEGKQEIPAEFQDEKTAIKVGVLAMFSAEAALNMYLPSAQLSTITIAELHRLLASVESPVYEKILESPAYSFYFLSLRKGGDEAIEEIGKAFAEHCRHEGSEKYIALGKDVYNVVQKEVQKQIKLLEFAD